MEENKEKKKVSLVLVILIGLVVAGAFGYACYEIGKKDIIKDKEKIEEKHKDNEQPIENNGEAHRQGKNVILRTRVYDVAKLLVIKQDDLHGEYYVGVDQDVKCQVGIDGYLNSDCLIDELKDKKIVDIASVSNEFFDDIYVLSEDGVIYFKDGKTFRNVSNEYKILDKVNDIGHINIFDGCGVLDLLVYTTSKGTYVIDENIEPLEKEKVIFYGIDTCSEIISVFQDIYIHIDGTLSLDGKYITDQDTNEKVVVDYLVLQVKNNEEKLYLVGRNKKLYILDKFEEKVKAYSDVVNINYDDTSENERINIKLANGESFEFVNEY